MSSHKKEIGRVPLGKWIHIEMACPLGDRATGTFDLRFGAVGDKATELKALPCDPNFRELQWLGFCADAKVAAAFYVDNIKLEAGKE